MKYPDETLMAYVDMEVDINTRREIDAAIASDPALAARVAEQRALLAQVQAAYAPIAAEPIPTRLLDALRAVEAASGAEKVISFAAAQARKEKEKFAAKSPTARPAWSWQMLGGIAASLVIGVMLGRSGMTGPDAGMLSAQGGQLLAQGTLAAALNTQASSDASAGAPVKIGLSFAAKSGNYCRAFMLKDGPSAGVACRDNGDWRIQLLSRERAGAQAGANYRMAGSAMPDSILRLVDAEMAGEALDAAGERAAIQQGWKALPR